jgi:hypothetical protein
VTTRAEVVAFIDDGFARGLTIEQIADASIADKALSDSMLDAGLKALVCDLLEFLQWREERKTRS